MIHTMPLVNTFTKTITIYPSIQWVKCDNLVDIDTRIEAEVEMLVDRDYGSDADGRRGTTRTWINLITLFSMSIRIGGRDGGRIWMKVADTEAEIRQHVTEKEYDYIIECVSDEVWEV